MQKKIQKEHMEYYNIPRLDQCIKNIHKIYNINLVSFAEDYVSYFFDMPTKWDRTIEKYLSSGYKYDEYDLINSRNKFDIKGIYLKCNYMPFMKNTKRDLELLLYMAYDRYIDKVPTEYKKKYLESMQVEV